MIVGVVPIGGLGTRLGLTFSKEMLPQKDTSLYNPISNHLVNKMLEAGAEKIIFIHGDDFKIDVTSFYTTNEHKHYKQSKTGFANVLYEAYKIENIKKNDIVLFGMPDTIFEDNLYIQMVKESGVVAGLFVTDSESKVDRLDKAGQKFHVKTELDMNTTENFWGILKFDGQNISDAIEQGLFDMYSEVGPIVNSFKFTTVQGGKYIDLGTWKNYNRYLSNGYY
jgi:hypothetical protein